MPPVQSGSSQNFSLDLSIMDRLREGLSGLTEQLDSLQSSLSESAPQAFSATDTLNQIFGQLETGLSGLEGNLSDMSSKLNDINVEGMPQLPGGGSGPEGSGASAPVTQEEVQAKLDEVLGNLDQQLSGINTEVSGLNQQVGSFDWSSLGSDFDWSSISAGVGTGTGSGNGNGFGNNNVGDGSGNGNGNGAGFDPSQLSARLAQIQQQIGGANASFGDVSGSLSSGSFFSSGSFDTSWMEGTGAVDPTASSASRLANAGDYGAASSLDPSDSSASVAVDSQQFNNDVSGQ